MEQSLNEELKKIDKDLHRFVQVIATETPDFSIERHNGKYGEGSQGGSHILCKLVTEWSFVNLDDRKSYASSMCHRETRSPLE